MATHETSNNNNDTSLTAIRVAGFKCFRDPVDVAIRPLTIFAGANSAGKSSLMQPLLFLKQTMENTFDVWPLLLDGPIVYSEQGASLFWRGKTKEDHAQEWSVETQGKGHWLRFTFEYPVENSGLRLKTTEDLIAATTSKDTDIRLLSSPFPYLIHLPGLRGKPHDYPMTRPEERGSRFTGPFHPYTAGLLLGWKERHDPRLMAIGDDLRLLGLSWTVDVRQRGDTKIEVQLGRLPNSQKDNAMDMVNISDVGIGASQVLPIIVALRAAKRGQVVHIEQPELHLHPRAQRALADLLVAAALRGVVLIIETHSSILLKEVQIRIAKGAIKPEHVALHWFTRDHDGAAQVRTADIEANGAYGDWPVDFDDVEMDVERDYIEAAFNK